jgi:hypothetical protein
MGPKLALRSEKKTEYSSSTEEQTTTKTTKNLFIID